MARCLLAERNMRLFCKFFKVDLFDLKPNWAHPCQESKEMVWLWLFVTLFFLRVGWTTFNTLYITIDYFDCTAVPLNVPLLIQSTEVYIPVDYRHGRGNLQISKKCNITTEMNGCSYDIKTPNHYM